jgi:hypothetical protein
MIFNANRDALAANPNNLPAGLQLILPCEDGRLTPTQVGSVIEQQTVAQESRPKKQHLRTAAQVRDLERLGALHR